MKRYIRFFTIATLLMSSLPTFAQKEWQNVLKGNKQYNNEQFTEAEVNYRKGLEKNANSMEAHFNLGDALFRQEKFPEAVEEWQKAISNIPTQKDGKYADAAKKQLSAAYHNIGNACYAAQDYGKAVEAFKQSLMLNPKDDETRYNLIKAMQMLQQQQQQQDQQQDQQDQNNRQDQQQQQQQQQEQEQNQQDQEKDQDDQQMDKEQAEQILQALQQDEQDTQEKAKRQQMQSKFRTDKDW